MGAALGEPFERAWRGEANFLENERMFLGRNGYLEETFFTFALSQIRDESGAVGGLFHPVAVLNRGPLEPGMNIMTKPFDMDELINRAQEVAGRNDGAHG